MVVEGCQKSDPVWIARERGRNSRAQVIPHGFSAKRANGAQNVAASGYSTDQTLDDETAEHVEVA